MSLALTHHADFHPSYVFYPQGEKTYKKIKYHAAEHPELVEGQAKAALCVNPSFKKTNKQHYSTPHLTAVALARFPAPAGHHAPAHPPARAARAYRRR